MLARSGLIVCPCPVPVSLTSSLPSSMTPACIHFRIKRSTLPSRTRFSISSMSCCRTLESQYAVTSRSRIHPVGLVPRVLRLTYVSFNRYVTLFPPPLQWIPWPLLFGSPADLHLPWYYGVVRLLFHPSSIASGFPWRLSFLSCREEMGSSPGFVGNPWKHALS